MTDTRTCPVCGSTAWTIDYDWAPGMDDEQKITRCTCCEWPPPYPTTITEWRARLATKDQP